MNNKLTTFDITKYLDSNEVIAEYLSQILEDGNIDELLDAICEIARAKGMSQIDKHDGLEILKEFNIDITDNIEKFLNQLKIPSESSQKSMDEIERGEVVRYASDDPIAEMMKDLKEPNAKTQQAMKEADEKIGKTISYDEFIKEIEADDT